MCKCNQKELCCKMQKEGLRVAVEGLKDKKMSSNSVLELLTAIQNLLLTYDCLPSSCLVNRIDEVSKSIIPADFISLTKTERFLVTMLIAELTAFLDN